MRRIKSLKKSIWILLLVILVNGNISLLAQTPQTGKSVEQKQIVTEIKNDNYLIYVTDSQADTKTLVATVDLTETHPLFETLMSISPDQKKLLFITADSVGLDNAKIYLAATDGTGAQQLATFEDDLWTVKPVWSPDSQQLALVRRESPADGNPKLGLWILSIKNGNLTRVNTEASFRHDIFLGRPHEVISWSDDGEALQYTDRTEKIPRVYEVNIKTGNTQSWEAPERTIAQDASIQSLTCSVPIFNQSSYENVMQTCGLTIHYAGCALTSVTMVAKYYGVDGITPPVMNSRLGNSACLLKWGRVDDNDVTRGKMRLTRQQEPFSYSRLESDLNNGRPPMVWLRRGTDDTHFVVVTSGSGSNPSNYHINDPADGSTNKTLANYTNTGWRLYQIDTYSGTPACSNTDGGDISYGQTKNGSVSPSYDRDEFYFNGSSGDTVTIRMSKDGGSLDTYLKVYKPNGYLLGSNDDIGGGNLNSQLTKTLPTSGRYKIVAKGYSSSTGAYTLQLTKESASDQDDRQWIAFGQTKNATISPSNDRDSYYFNGSAGTAVSIRMNQSGSSLDSYLELYDSSGNKIAYNDDGGGGRNSWFVKELPANGNYRIVARSYNNGSSGGYSLSLTRHTSNNLALNRSAWATSTEFRGVEAYKAFDGRTDTRWSSRFEDPQLIYVNLGSNKTFNKVILKWENAYAKRYGIYYWDGSKWVNVFWTNNGDGGIDTITFSSKTARYVAMYGVERGTGWGYSLWEFEVYNTLDLLMPLIPPDPSDKEVDSIVPLAPLGPSEDGKEVELVGENEDAQEDFPLATTAIEDDPTDFSTESPPYAEIISPNELDVFLTGPDYYRFEGYAVDNDENGESIVAYSWRSSLDNNIGTQRLFTIPVTSLSNGLHTIYFKAQDNEGNWSEEVTTTLQVGEEHKIYLPIVLK